jgi:hypothetical protein
MEHSENAREAVLLRFLPLFFMRLVWARFRQLQTYEAQRLQNFY